MREETYRWEIVGLLDNPEDSAIVLVENFVGTWDEAQALGTLQAAESVEAANIYQIICNRKGRATP